MPERPSSSRLGLVVDGGGTKTDCQLLDTSHAPPIVLGYGTATGSNPAAVGIDAADSAIRTAVQRATTAARIDPRTQVQRAALAIAGTVEDSLRRQLESAVSTPPIALECRVFPDVLPVVLAASPAGPAAAIIAGTGSVAVVHDGGGVYSLTGGWGYLLGDEGSGYALGREALRHALEQLEQGGPVSPLVERLLGKLKTSSIAGLKKAVYQAAQPRREIAHLARVVIEAVDLGDPRTDHILHQAAADLVSLLERAITRCDLKPGAVPIAAAGGLLHCNSPLRAIFESRLKSRGHLVNVRYLDQPLAAGQLLLRDEVFTATHTFTG